jgi:prophage antirepressor-like protein
LICKVLGYTGNASQAVRTSVADEDVAYVPVDNKGKVTGGIYTVYTPMQGNQLVINESGLYALMLGSRKPDAKRFKKWVTSEVLPQIRQTGSYLQQPKTPAELILLQAQQLVAHERKLENHDQRIYALEARVDAKDEWTEHFSIIAYCKLHGIDLPDLQRAQNWGKRATKLSKDRGRTIGKTSDPRYGTVGLYHVSILDEVIGSIQSH